MEGLIRLSELARRSDVPPATIKHYVREGLLPGPSQRTGRTMAYYDEALVSRVQAIRELQQKRFLPLSVIKSVLDGADPYRSEETARALESALTSAAPPERRTRKQMIDGGVDEDQLSFFESVGFITGKGKGASRYYEGDDVELLRTLAAARRQGLSPELLPHTIVGPYMQALRALVRAELAMFRQGLTSADPTADVGALVQSASKLSERLILLLRRKLLMPTLYELTEETKQTKAEAPAPSRANARPEPRNKPKRVTTKATRSRR